MAVALACALTLGAGTCADSLASSVLVIPRSGSLEPYRFFGDRTVTVPLLVHASEPGELTLRAQLVQLTADLAVPIGALIEVPLPRNAAPQGSIEIELSTPLPAVARETAFELWIRSRRGRQTVWDMAGRIALRVYPADLLGPVRRWATAHPLRVNDDHGTLLEFLRRQEIPVVGVTGARDSRAGRTVTLYTGPQASRQHAHVPIREGEAVVLFTERHTDTPRVLIERAGGRTAVTVEMRLLDRLATDPLAQRILLELFELVHEDRPSPGGDVR